MNALNKEILRLSIPSILANLTVPLVGLVDTAVVGHIPVESAASLIGAVSVGTMLFNLIYWNFGFLRTGTGGLTAQAFGRKDPADCVRILVRGLGLAFASAILTICLQTPFLKLALLAVGGTPEVADLATQYFRIRIWAAPATLSLMALSGWFVGMQDSMSSMWKDLVVNSVNIAASIILCIGIGRWKGFGFAGVALGTVVAQYAGLLFCLLVCCLKYGKRVFAKVHSDDLKAIFRTDSLKSFFGMNANLFGRSVFFTAIYIGYTLIASHQGDIVLACSSIMMQLLMIFSYFTDGFAYAGEALSGRFIGASDLLNLRRSVKYTFIWSMGIGLIFIAIYRATGSLLLSALTSDVSVVSACEGFLPWLMLMPPIGCAAFFWDGIYLGATASRSIFIAMFGAAICFFAVWFTGAAVMGTPLLSMKAMHLLLGAYFAHLLFRAVYLSVRYRKDILRRYFDLTALTGRP